MSEVHFAINIPFDQGLDDDDDEFLHEPLGHDAQPTKSVLKKEGSSKKTSTAPIMIPDSSKSNKKKTSKKELKWDEQVIEEHDLLRGSRMKV